MRFLVVPFLVLVFVVRTGVARADVYGRAVKLQNEIVRTILKQPKGAWAEYVVKYQGNTMRQKAVNLGKINRFTVEEFQYPGGAAQVWLKLIKRRVIYRHRLHTVLVLKPVKMYLLQKGKVLVMNEDEIEADREINGSAAMKELIVPEGSRELRIKDYFYKVPATKDVLKAVDVEFINKDSDKVEIVLSKRVPLCLLKRREGMVYSYLYNYGFHGGKAVISRSMRKRAVPFSEVFGKALENSGEEKSGGDGVIQLPKGFKLPDNLKDLLGN